MTTTLYGLKSCDSCRNARRWLDENDIAFAYHDVRADGLTRQLIDRWLDRVDWSQLLNKRSTTWRQLADRDKHELNATRATALFIQHPTLVKRPVLEVDGQVLVGFSVAAYTKALRG